MDVVVLEANGSNGSLGVIRHDRVTQAVVIPPMYFIFHFDIEPSKQLKDRKVTILSFDGDHASGFVDVVNRAFHRHVAFFLHFFATGLVGKAIAPLFESFAIQ